MTAIATRYSTQHPGEAARYSKSRSLRAAPGQTLSPKRKARVVAYANGAFVVLGLVVLTSVQILSP